MRIVAARGITMSIGHSPGRAAIRPPATSAGDSPETYAVRERPLTAHRRIDLSADDGSTVVAGRISVRYESATGSRLRTGRLPMVRFPDGG